MGFGISWKSKDEYGEVTAVTDGSAVISAVNSFSGLTAVCNVTVLKDENARIPVQIVPAFE